MVKFEVVNGKVRRAKTRKSVSQRIADKKRKRVVSPGKALHHASTSAKTRSKRN